MIIPDCFFNHCKGRRNHRIPVLQESEIIQLYENIRQLPSLDIYYSHDLKVYDEISEKVKAGNRDNVTRTTFYLSFFNKHPDIHWAFLAHMVSRNAGYHMTDIRSRLLSAFLTEREQADLFSFLDLCNAAIFRDAFPQLLLYEKWKETGRTFFHLLRKFHVSAFMRTVWDRFLSNGNQSMLTVAMIMNEQHMVENRILLQPEVNFGVEKWKFLLQDRLEFASILFPHGERHPLSLAGHGVSHFEQVHRRILLGKRLYQILFHQSVYPSALSFANHHVHTGSRSDYWPHIYTSHDTPSRLYSPFLRDVWDESALISVPTSDWFTDQTIDVMMPLSSLPTPRHFSMSKKWKTKTSVLLTLKREQRK
ncbi:DUF2515 family protein [Bacillus sp. KH172YL63]|uniref:DUF2515 family protein n=1 Tax=Bacillus sp. KH172YL63 TaxID=2709784 RepID=UPI001564BBDD|nr:DUF2515 family protein [Bacillus sp. KH172YL63]